MPLAPLAQPQFSPPDPAAALRRVCFVAPFGLGHKTTVWARTLPLAKALAQHGWAAAILIPPWDTPADAGKRWLESGSLRPSESAGSSATPGAVEIINVTLGGGPLAVTYRLLREISTAQPQIIHIIKPRAYAGLVQWALWQRRHSDSPPILLDIDDWEQAWASINRYPWPLARFGAWQEEWGIRHAHGITAASHWLVERAASDAPHTPVLYLPNGVSDTPAAVPQRSPDAGNVLFFTRFVEVPPAWLGAFAASLYVIHPQARLIVAGAPVQPGLDEPFRRAVGDALAAAGAPADHVQWLGFVTPAEMPPLYARCGCAIFPAAPVPLQQAKCSVRLATTLLQGIPVVASAVGEQAAYGADGAARLVPAAASPAEFAAAVDDVLRHPAQQLALAAGARARLLSRYAWDKLGTELAEFYTKLLDSQRQQRPNQL